MHVYVQKFTATTFPRSPSGASGGELSHPVAPSKPGRCLSTGNAGCRPKSRAIWILPSDQEQYTLIPHRGGYRRFSLPLVPRTAGSRHGVLRRGLGRGGTFVRWRSSFFCCEVRVVVW